MHLKINHETKILSLIVIVVLVFSPLLTAQASTTQTKTSTVQLTATSEYTNYVHNFVSAEGNCTYVEKPVFPVLIKSEQIPIGESWTIICPLQEGHNYHIYFYGAYINTSTAAITDYDVYVYTPDGNLESTHTQSAGLPEHLGTTVNTALFTPTQSGNYTFVINNNPVDSKGTQEATFMIIENLPCDQWYSSFVEGTNGGEANFYTNWAYEFETNASYVQLYVKVPDTLDMYEARLYLMNNAASPSLDKFPLAWEPGLYGNLTGSVGGYNFEPNSYRGAAYASCEYMGESMSLNYTSPNHGPNLYHLALIGEVGSGNIQFMLKTNFENSSLIPLTIPSRVCPGDSAQLKFTSNNTQLETAKLSYTTDNWNSTNTLDMDISNQTCMATIPGQNAGTLVQYKINATDVLENGVYAKGNYTVKEQSTLNITPVENKIRLGENITINGILTLDNNDSVAVPDYNSSMVEVQFSRSNLTKTVDCIVSSNGTFVASFRPNSSGLWAVFATVPETRTSFRTDSQELSINVAEPPIYVKYSLFIVAALIAALAVSGVVYFLKFRES
ncbi:MAG: hypothetical protein ABSF44_12095 [Candidatus Bathyarchaeia archaeon]|jgi:hypothetical protein